MKGSKYLMKSETPTWGDFNNREFPKTAAHYDRAAKKILIPRTFNTTKFAL